MLDDDNEIIAKGFLTHFEYEAKIDRELRDIIQVGTTLTADQEPIPRPKPNNQPST